MKRYLISTFIFITFLSYGQRNHVIFNLDESVYEHVDSIVFKSKKIDKYKTFVKVPRKRKIKFYIFKNEQKVLITLKKYDFHSFNTINMESNSDRKQKIVFYKAHFIRHTSSKEKLPFYVSINLKLHNAILVKQNKELTINSKLFDKGIKDNPEFFLL